MRGFFIIVLSLATCLEASAWDLLYKNLKGWQTETLKLAVNYSHCSISRKRLDRALEGAIELWNSGPTRFKFQREVTETTVEHFLNNQGPAFPVVLCDPQFTKHHSSLNAKNIPAVSRTLTRANRLGYAGILLNAQHGAQANIARLNPLALRNVIAHELGHILGLGHSHDTRSVMYPTTSTKRLMQLVHDDEEALRFLYPMPKDHLSASKEPLEEELKLELQSSEKPVG